MISSLVGAGGNGALEVLMKVIVIRRKDLKDRVTISQLLAAGYSLQVAR